MSAYSHDFPVSGMVDNRAPRSARMWKLHGRDVSNRSFEIVMRNLSATGLGGISDYPLSVGRQIYVDLPGIGSVAGQVMWINGKRFGLRFAEPIDMARLSTPNAAPASTYRPPDNLFIAAKPYRPGLRTR